MEGRIPGQRRGAVILTTLGSLGDLYPLLSVARALEDMGIEARLALSPDDCGMARTWGLHATGVGPTKAEVLSRTGMTRDAVAAAVLRDPGRLIDRVLIPALPGMVRELGRLTDGAACICGTAFAMAGPLAAERAGLPFVPLQLQPMLTFSALDPPRGRGFGTAFAAARGRLQRRWNAALMGTARRVLRMRHLGPLNATRRDLGLPPFAGTPLLDPGGADVPLRLGLWSELFSPKPGDAPDALRIVGFPAAPEGDLPRDLQTWLDAGPAPLVVTLGSIAQGIAGPRFWPEAVALARALGLRAVLLHGQAEVPEGADLVALPYAAHAPLFPQAAAVLHHGGIGTTAEALRAARPQLVVPVGGDQPDNAARVARLGLGVTLAARRFRADRAGPLLRTFMESFDFAVAADRGRAIAATDGAREAAIHLAALLPD